jgi:hypothetical protein
MFVLMGALLLANSIPTDVGCFLSGAILPWPARWPTAAAAGSSRRWWMSAAARTVCSWSRGARPRPPRPPPAPATSSSSPRSPSTSCGGSRCASAATWRRSSSCRSPRPCTRTASCCGASACGRSCRTDRSESVAGRRRTSSFQTRTSHGAGPDPAPGGHLQMVLPLERLPAHGAHVLPFVAVGQLVLRQSRRVPKHFGTYLRQNRTR